MVSFFFNFFSHYFLQLLICCKCKGANLELVVVVYYNLESVSSVFNTTCVYFTSEMSVLMFFAEFDS